METLGHSTPGHRTLLCFTHVGIVTFGNVSPRLSLGPSWRGPAGMFQRSGTPTSAVTEAFRYRPHDGDPGGSPWAGRDPEAGWPGRAVGPPRVGSCLELLSIVGGWSSWGPQGGPRFLR